MSSDNIIISLTLNTLYIYTNTFIRTYYYVSNKIHVKFAKKTNV